MELTPYNIILLKRISQYLSLNSISAMDAKNGKAIDQRVGRMIYVEGKSLEIRYAQNSADSSLQGVANYVYSLLGPWALQAQNILNNLSVALPTIAGPTTQFVNVGQSATFSIVVTSSGPYTIQWYDSNSNPILGATGVNYIFPNAQLVNSGNTFFARVTNAAGVTVSTVASLIVTQAIIGSYYYGSTDYSAQLLANTDTVPYLNTFPITTGQPLSISLPAAAANTFMVFRYPSTESIKTSYTNLPQNVGLIPSLAWNAVVTFGGFNYIFTRQGNTFGLNYLNPLIFS